MTEGRYGNLYITKDVSSQFSSEISGVWDYNTILFAPLKSNLLAGNIEYSAEQISSIRIKRRRVGTHQWITIDEVAVNSIEDLKFERYDKFARAAEYEFALIPVVGGVEGNMNINTIQSDFSGIYIVDKENSFGTILDIALKSVNRVKPTSVISTMGNKYPFVVSNGSINYDSGEIKALFLEQDSNNEWIVKGNYSYRKRLTDFLSNGKPKILKMDDGRCWIIRVVNDIVNSEDGHPDKVAISFSWVQTGDDESSNDLYFNNFSDVNVEGV